MIDKLRKKISLIVLFAISIPIIFIVVISNVSYYNNMIRSTTKFVDRFFGEHNGFSKDGAEKLKIDNLDGVYYISISNGKVFQASNNVTNEINEYAKKIYDKDSIDGIIENYIYKKINHESNHKDTTIILIESSNEINKVKLIIILSILVSVIGFFLIFMLSKRIARVIIKPVEDTFNKQRDFISDASHELKTPLAVISANADVLEGEIGNNKWLIYIQNETDNMNKLVSELLLLTKIENIDKLRKPEKFNMSDHIELIASSFESMAFEKNIKIENKIEKDIITDTFNKDDIAHVLSTLIDNGIKHTKKNNDVIVELKKNKDKLIINVKNKGEEIPISERKKIFDRFYRIDKSRNRSEKRYGLGLSIAKAIVLKNNGTIQVDYKNGYTVFTVELPL